MFARFWIKRVDIDRMSLASMAVDPTHDRAVRMMGFLVLVFFILFNYIIMNYEYIYIYIQPYDILRNALAIWRSSH